VFYLQPAWPIVSKAFTGEQEMNNIKLGTNFVVFLLFFGVAALDAFQAHSWPKAALWLAIGTVFLMADNLKR
jgi:hypothetical protein